MTDDEINEMFPDWTEEPFGLAGYTLFAMMAEIIQDSELHKEGVEAEDIEALLDACYVFVKFCQKHQRKVELADLEAIWDRS
mgnify:CR=1 FL=1